MDKRAFVRRRNGTARVIDLPGLYPRVTAQASIVIHYAKLFSNPLCRRVREEKIPLSLSLVYVYTHYECLCCLSSKNAGIVNRREKTRL